MSKIEFLRKSTQCQPDSIGARSELARRIDEAHDALARLEAQELSIQDSIQDSCQAIQESRILLMEIGKAQVEFDLGS